MPKPKLDWDDFPEGWLAEVAHYCSTRGGMAMFMYGGHGYYYKVSWWYYDNGEDGKRTEGMASGETTHDLMRLVSKRLYGVFDNLG